MRVSEKGTTLVETIIALSIAVVIIGGITSLVITSLNNANYTKVQDQAESLAQEGIETVRQMANSNYSTFSNNYNQTYYCMAPDLKLVPDTNCNQTKYRIKNVYIREVDISQSSDCAQSSVSPTPTPPPGSANIRVIVKVSWTDSKCKTPFCHKISYSSCLVDNDTINSLGI